jgi:hypothetical protein
MLQAADCSLASHESRPVSNVRWPAIDWSRAEKKSTADADCNRRKPLHAWSAIPRKSLARSVRIPAAKKVVWGFLARIKKIKHPLILGKSASAQVGLQIKIGCVELWLIGHVTCITTRTSGKVATCVFHWALVVLSSVYDVIGRRKAEFAWEFRPRASTPRR